jgi:hypothetical protein
MNELLKQISQKYGVDYNVIEQIIKIEKNNVYKKTRRNIFGDLKEVVDKVIESEEHSNDHQ